MTKRGIRIEKPHLDAPEEGRQAPKPKRVGPFFTLLLILSFFVAFAGLALGLYVLFLE
ncbi:MAG TPA: hypothetical protein VD913_00960 [bacterium]|nr:hypothetical protein [bacterium]